MKRPTNMAIFPPPSLALPSQGGKIDQWCLSATDRVGGKGDTLTQDTDINLSVMRKEAW